MTNTTHTSSSKQLNVKVVGAGSIGNHLSRACRRLGLAVTVTDTDERALKRMKEEIYPTRYGAWDTEIKQFVSGNEPQGGYDLVLVGTPPDSHLQIAEAELRASVPPKVLQLEKPLCSPNSEEISGFELLAQKSKCMIVVGYNYVTSDSVRKVEELIKEHDLGTLLTLDSNLLAHWGDILKAHPWLKGPEDTYLGFWEKGGGASGEHSHALHLWQHLAHAAGAGRVTHVQSYMDYVDNGTIKYDRVCLLSLKTESGIVGRVGQDVTTRPTEKKAVLRFERGHIEWRGAIRPGVDEIRLFEYDKDLVPTVIEIELSPADSYLREMEHILGLIQDPSLYDSSPLRLERGLDTMKVLERAHAGGAQSLVTL